MNAANPAKTIPLIYLTPLFGIVLLGLCFLGGLTFETALPAAALVSLTVLPALTAATQREFDPFSPLQLVSAYFFLYYGARLIYLHLASNAIRLGFLSYDDYLSSAGWLAALAFCAFVGGYGLTQSAGFANRVLRRCPRLPSNPPIGRLLFLLTIGVLAHLATLSYGVVVGRTYTQQGLKEIAENPIPGWLPPCSGLVELSFCYAATYALGPDAPLGKRRICKVIAATCFACSIFKTFSQGVREPFLLALALLLLSYHYTRRRVGVALLGTVLVSGFVMFPTIQLLRSRFILATGGPPSTLEGLSAIASNSMEYFQSTSVGEFANLGLASVLDRSQGIDALALVVKYTPERAPWGLGRSYLSIPVQVLVPRALWEDKPILNDHLEFERAYMGIRFLAQTSPHVLVDFYRNFAIFGFLLAAAGLGVLFKAIYSILLQSGGRQEIVVLYSYLILCSLHELEAAVVSGAVIMVRVSVIMAFSLWLLCSGRPAPESPIRVGA